MTAMTGHATTFDPDATDWACQKDGCYFRTEDTALAGLHDAAGTMDGGDQWAGVRLSLETALEKANHEGAAFALGALLPLIYKELNEAEKTFGKDKRDVSQAEHARACAIQSLCLDLIEEVKSREALAHFWPAMPPDPDAL